MFRESNGNGHEPKTNGVAERIELERLDALLSEKERRQSAKQQRLEQLQGDVNRHNEAIQRKIDISTESHEADVVRIDEEIARARMAYEEARRVAAEAEANLDEVEVTPASVIIREMGLPGSGLSVKATRKIKPVLTLASIIVSGFSLGIVTRVLTPKHLFDRLDGIVLSLIFGVAVSLGLLLLSAQGWGLYGGRVGRRNNVSQTPWPLVALTFALLAIFAYLDGHAIFVLNAARASFNPELQIDKATSILIGSCLSGLYIGGLCFAGYVDGYNAAVAKIVEAEQDLERHAARKDPVYRGRAYEDRRCRKNRDLAEAELEELEGRRKAMRDAFEAQRTALQDGFKEPPEHLADADDSGLEALIEKQKLRVNAERMRSEGTLS